MAAVGRDPDAEPSRGLALPYALETLMDELAMPPVVMLEQRGCEFTTEMLEAVEA